jgi:hypothetical protein
MSALTITALYPVGVTNLGALDGSCTAVITGGTSPYQSSIDTVNWIPGNTVNNLAPGNYTFYVKDNVGTIVSAPFTVDTYPQIVNLKVTDETGLNLQNGSITFNILGGQSPYYYSIDGIKFELATSSTVNIFPIPHGSYTLTVVDSQQSPVTIKTPFVINQYLPIQGCTDPAASNYNPNAQINDGSCVYPDPDPNNPYTVNNLYAGPDQFRLVTTDNLVYDIDEPKDYDKISIVLMRDKTYHGVNYEFTEGDIKLRFDDSAGRQLILADYNKYGNDAMMRLQFGFILNGAFVPNFDLNFDFNTYEVQENFVLCGVKRKTFNDLLETRKDTIVNISAGEFDLPLHSKTIREETVTAQQTKTSAITQIPTLNPYNGKALAGDPPFNEYVTYLDWEDANPNDLFGAGDGPPVFGVYAEVPEDVREHVFVADGSGPVTFNLNFKVKLYTYLTGAVGIGRVGYWSYQWYISVNNAGNRTLLQDVGGNATTGFLNDGQPTNVMYYQVHQSVTINVKQGDEVYLYGQYIFENRAGAGTPALITYLESYYNQSSIFFDSVSSATSTKALLGFEFMQLVLDGVGSNFQNIKLKSNLLGRTDIGYPSNGCASLIAYTNGYQIRGFDNVSRPMQTCLADRLTSLNALHCIGLGYELDENNNYIVRIEGFEYFYQDVEIILFDQVSDYLEDIDTSLIYNEIEIGYQKYTNNLPSSSNTLDEFCTLHDYLTPIVSFKQKFSQKCKDVFSGYAIELTRRVQQANTTTDSWTYDEDIFGISCLENLAGGYVPEKNENFYIQPGTVLGPDSVYNIRYTVKRMLYNWHKWLNSGFAYKSLTDILINTYAALNNKIVSQEKDGSPCGSSQQFKESSNLYLAEYGDFEKLFFPTVITFKKRIDWGTFRMLKRCFQGQDTTGRNNGYISVVDPKGVIKQGFLTELSYNPESELGSFTLRQKFVDNNIPFDCSQYATFDFAEFEASTGIPADIEQCRFENFE